MKKLIYLLLATSFVFTGCDPMDDIHEEIDAEIDNTINGTISITFGEEDYEAIDNDDVQNAHLFTSVDQANEYIPAYLDEEYPVLDKGSIAMVTVEVREPLNGAPSVTNYTVTSQDYEDMGLNFGNFDDVNDIYDFLEFKYPNAEEGQVVRLTYQWYNGQVNTRTNDFILTSGGWSMDVVVLRSADYTVMGQSYSNFDNATQALHKIPVFLGEKFPYALPGTTKEVFFAIYMGGGVTNHYKVPFTLEGDTWQGGFTTTLQFGHNGSEWEPDNTIVHVMTDADFEYIGEQLMTEYPVQADSAGYYGNFDRRPTNAAYWSNAMILEAIDILLNNLDPDAEEGQKYTVKYAIYNGSAGVESMNVIKENGEWVLNE